MRYIMLGTINELSPEGQYSFTLGGQALLPFFRLIFESENTARNFNHEIPEIIVPHGKRRFIAFTLVC